MRMLQAQIYVQAKVSFYEVFTEIQAVARKGCVMRYPGYYTINEIVDEFKCSMKMVSTLRAYGIFDGFTQQQGRKHILLEESRVREVIPFALANNSLGLIQLLYGDMNIINITDAAKIFKVSSRTLQTMIQHGEVQSLPVKPRNKRYYRVSDFIVWAESKGVFYDKEFVKQQFGSSEIERVS